MATTPTAEELEALTLLLKTLGALEEESRDRVLRVLSNYFDRHPAKENLDLSLRADLYKESSREKSSSPEYRPFAHVEMSPKEFLVVKKPNTEVERVACLAYYLGQYRDTPNFRTLDISLLNTEAAQPKFSNAARSVDHALKAGYLAHGAKGFKQLSALGESFVLALPDRDAAREVLKEGRIRRPRRTAKSIAKK